MVYRYTGRRGDRVIHLHYFELGRRHDSPIYSSYLSQVAFTHAILPLLEQTAKESGSDVRIVNVCLTTAS